jgi:hypothetical protein
LTTGSWLIQGEDESCSGSLMDLPERQQEEQLQKQQQQELNGNGLTKRGGRKGGNGRKRKAKSEPSSSGEKRMKIRRKSGASGTGDAVSYKDLQNQVGFLKF